MKLRTTLLSLGLCLTAGLPAQDPQLAALAGIEKNLAQEQSVYRKSIAKLAKTEPYRAALAKRDYDTLRKLRKQIKPVPLQEFLTAFARLEEQCRGRAAGIGCLRAILTYGSRAPDTVVEAVRRIEQHYIGNSGLLPVAELLIRSQRHLERERYQELLDAIIAGNPNQQVVAQAYYCRAQLHKPRRNRGRRVRPGRELIGGDKAKYEADLAMVVKLAKGSLLADRALAPKFEQERLQIGMTVPDIVGKDIDGVAFKLSDYRGKVVLLDFWGDW